MFNGQVISQDSDEHHIYPKLPIKVLHVGGQWCVDEVSNLKHYYYGNVHWGNDYMKNTGKYIMKQ